MYLKQHFKRNLLCNMFLVKRLKASASKMAVEGCQILHGPTTHLWKTCKTNLDLPKNTNIVSWNVNGFRSVLRNGQFDFLVSKCKPDIICMTQTKMCKKIHQGGLKDKPEKFFYQYWNFCKVSSGYSGVAVFSRWMPKEVHEDFSLLGKEAVGEEDPMNLEGRLLTLQYNNCYLVTVYMPNAGAALNRLEFKKKYFQTFVKYLNFLKAKKPVILCGDMNVAHNPIDLARPQQNVHNAGFTSIERDQFKKLLDAGFIDCYRQSFPDKQEFTWWSPRGKAREKNVGWRIDYFLVDQSLKDKYANPKIFKQIPGSDHCPVSINLQL